MRTYKLLLLSFLITTFLSCQQEIESNLDGTVQFNLSFQEENVITNSRTSIVSTDDFSIAIFDKGTDEEVAFYERFEDMPSSITLAQGDYKAVASSSGTSTADFNNPSYYGEVDFTVNATELTATTVECYLSNIRVRITHTEDTKIRFPDVVTIVSIGTESLEYTQNENRSGYFPAGEETSELKISIQYTQNGILRTSTRTYEASANDFYDISINTQIQGEGSMNVKIEKENLIQDEIMIGLDTFTTIDFLTKNSTSESKNWVFDKLNKGHMGIGAVNGSTTPNWWQTYPLELEGLGVYDDVITFIKEGNKFELINNGDTRFNADMNDWFISRGGEISDYSENTYLIEFEDQSDWTWSVIEKEDGEYLVFGGDAFPSWQVGGTEYLIQNINENELYLRTIGVDGNAWYYRFIREGYDKPSIEEYSKKLEEHDIYDDFVGYSNITFENVNGLNFTESAANIDLKGNNVDYVGYYVRTPIEGEEGWWQSYEAELPYFIDLSERRIFSLKVYIPNSTDFSTLTPSNLTPSWLEDLSLSPTVTLRLANSNNRGAWSNRADVVYTLSEGELGKWIEIKFDFSNVEVNVGGYYEGEPMYTKSALDINLYDRIVIQIGGEGHNQEGEFYISDFKLL